MSSLAGALDAEPHSPDAFISSPKSEDDLGDVPQPSTHAALSADEDTKEELNDLFGEDEDVNMVEHEPASSAASELADQDDGLSYQERRHREKLEYVEDEDPEPVVEHRLEADVAIPNIPVPRSSDGNYWVIRTPNYVKVDSKPFHPDTYIGPEQEDEESQNTETVREKSMSIKLKVENTIRWRWSKDGHGEDRRQSNARVVRWSDGSLSLQLGKELFDITQSIDTSSTVPRQAGALSASQTQTQLPPSQSQMSLSQSQSTMANAGGGGGQGLTYLVAQHKRAEILQCEALVTGYMSLRPTGMQSETHRMLVRAVGQKHSRVARLRMAPDPTTDPEREKLELAKAEARKPRKSRSGADDDGLGNSGRRRRSYTRRRTGDSMWSDDEDDDVGFGRGGSEDEYGDESAGTRRRKSGDENTKKGPGEYQEDDFLVADEDEEDADESSGRRKRKRAGHGRGDHAEEEEDDLERLEAKISQNEAAQRQRGKGGPGSGDETDEDAAGEDAMEVESEDEDDFGVRRAARSAPSSRKRRAIEVEDEDEE